MLRRHTGVGTDSDASIDEMALNPRGLKPFQFCAQQRAAVVHKTASILIPSQGKYHYRSDVSCRIPSQGRYQYCSDVAAEMA